MQAAINNLERLSQGTNMPEAEGADGKPFSKRLLKNNLSYL
ncbi:hypothetical protein SAMN04487935_1020 [Flavobacterium noncentrifugens]|uniref:Uncharacterized protein n=1 Tax=Flavobacterium noncentrifugens TaxID=1128970 RepID=A0A1G8UR60_9FLAO|nr:hypothetical protein SAMN04487935_1020 [Flavobacterium noncentrifugens]